MAFTLAAKVGHTDDSMQTPSPVGWLATRSPVGWPDTRRRREARRTMRRMVQAGKKV